MVKSGLRSLWMTPYKRNRKFSRKFNSTCCAALDLIKLQIKIFWHYSKHDSAFFGLIKLKTISKNRFHFKGFDKNLRRAFIIVKGSDSSHFMGQFMVLKLLENRFNNNLMFALFCCQAVWQI